MKKYLFILILLCNVRFSYKLYADIGSGNSFATQNPNTTNSSVTARGFVVTSGGVQFPDGSVQNTAGDSAVNTLDTSGSTQTKTGGLNLGGGLVVSSSVTVTGAVNISTYLVNSTQLFVSSGNTNGFGGFSICASSGPIPIGSNTTLVVGIAGFSTIRTPIVSEVRPLAQVATDSIGLVSVGVNTFTVFNADPANTKNFDWWALCRP